METDEKPTCSRCGEPEGFVPFESCAICKKTFCRDCAWRAPGGRKFCSEACGSYYYFHGDDDDESARASDDE